MRFVLEYLFPCIKAFELILLGWTLMKNKVYTRSTSSIRDESSITKFTVITTKKSNKHSNNIFVLVCQMLY